MWDLLCYSIDVYFIKKKYLKSDIFNLWAFSHYLFNCGTKSFLHALWKMLHPNNKKKVIPYFLVCYVMFLSIMCACKVFLPKSASVVLHVVQSFFNVDIISPSKKDSRAPGPWEALKLSSSSSELNFKLEAWDLGLLLVGSFPALTVKLLEVAPSFLETCCDLRFSLTR